LPCGGPNAALLLLPHGIGVVICAANVEIDISDMSLPQPSSERPKPARVPKNILRFMLVILMTLALVALYANVQKFRRDKIETATFKPASSPVASSSPIAR